MQIKNINNDFYDKAKYEESNKMEEKKGIYKEINNEFLEQKNELYSWYFKKEIIYKFWNFENNYNTIIDNVYYNRISTDTISIFEEKKSGKILFNFL